MQNLPCQSSKVLLLWSNIAEDMGWYGGAAVQSLTLKKKAETWLLVVKVRRNGVDWVCFSEGKTIDVACDLFAQFVLQKGQTGIKWTRSKY